LPEPVIALAKQIAFAQNDPAAVTLPQNGTDDAPGASSIVAPIKVRNVAVGALQLHPKRDDQSWSEDDLAVVEAIVDELAQTAESLRLFEETRERASFESLVGEITDKLRQAPTLDSLAKTAAEALGNALGVSHSLIKVGVTPPPKNSAQNGEKG
jgi:GAF domain-containing protein